MGCCSSNASNKKPSEGEIWQKVETLANEAGKVMNAAERQNGETFKRSLARVDAINDEILEILRANDIDISNDSVDELKEGDMVLLKPGTYDGSCLRGMAQAYASGGGGRHDKEGNYTLMDWTFADMKLYRVWVPDNANIGLLDCNAWELCRCKHSDILKVIGHVDYT